MEWLKGQLQAGLIAAAASSVVKPVDESDPVIEQYGYDTRKCETIIGIVPIPTERWMTDFPASSVSFWRIGTIAFSMGGKFLDQFHDVRFDPARISTMLPESMGYDPNATTAPTAQANLGGRPRADYWEDALIAMFEKLWLGELTPKTQAEIERAMADYIASVVQDGLVTDLCRSPVSLCYLGFECERTDAAQV